MALVGFYLGAAAITLLLSRLMLWLLKRMGDNERRILVAHAVVLALSVTLAAFGQANGGPPNFVYGLLAYGPPVLVWLAVDMLALRGRRARAARTPG